MKHRFSLHQFPNEESLADGVAARWLDQLAQTASGHAPYCAAISGGRIARRFFAGLAAQGQTAASKLSRVEFFWADERCVPPEDPESNFGIAQKLLFAPLALSAARIHRVRGEINPEQAVTEAASDLRRVSAKSKNGQPVLDLIFLGMGEDGHVASLFPANQPTQGTQIYQAVVASKPPPRRITLTYDVIAAAVEVWVIASGAGKTEALRESLRENGTTPLARVLRMRDQTEIFTDIPPAG